MFSLILIENDPKHIAKTTKKLVKASKIFNHIMIALFKNCPVVIQKQNPATCVTAEILTDWDVAPLHHYRRQKLL